MAVPEARLEPSDAGLVAASEGWFVVNVRDAAWVTNPVLGDACMFEGDPVPFEELGFTIAVLEPGQSGGRYHREDNQEDFLVLQGECIALIEGEERLLKAWDFVHCPAGTEHAFVGAGDGPCGSSCPVALHPHSAVYPRERARAAARRRRRAGDRPAAGGVRALPGPEAGPPGELRWPRPGGAS